MIKVESTVFCGKGGYRIFSEEKEVIVVTEIGPRIVSYQSTAGGNLLKCNGDDYIEGGEEYKFYGGHRLWHSPEDLVRSYIKDNDSCEVEVLKDGISVTSFEEETRLTKNMTVQMNKEGRVRIVHKIINNNLFDVELAPWAITMFKGGGVGIVAMDHFDSGLLPNRAIAFWPYSKGDDKRFVMKNRYLILDQKNTSENSFKVGTMSRRGFLGYLRNGTLFTIEYDVEEGDYTDFGSNVECFMNGDILELEVLGKINKISPGECAEVSEVWDIFYKVDLKSFEDDDVDEIFLGRVKCEV